MAAVAALSSRGKPFLSSFGKADSGNASRGWLSGVLAMPVAGAKCKILLSVFPYKPFLP